MSNDLAGYNDRPTQPIIPDRSTRVQRNKQSSRMRPTKPPIGRQDQVLLIAIILSVVSIPLFLLTKNVAIIPELNAPLLAIIIRMKWGNDDANLS